jgi:hypothetical protein
MNKRISSNQGGLECAQPRGSLESLINKMITRRAGCTAVAKGNVEQLVRRADHHLYGDRNH